MTADTAGTSGVVRPAPALLGSLRLPADKSVGQRALLFSAMGSGTAEILLDRPGEDVRSMAGALQTLGAVESLEADAGDMVRVVLRGGGTPNGAVLPGRGDEVLDCGNAGTAMRLLTGALADSDSANQVGCASLVSS